MLYSDVLFVFAFLPIALAIMFILREPWEKNAAAVLLSLVFICWGRHLYYALILLPVFATYFIARQLKKSYSRGLHILAGGLAGAYSIAAIFMLGGGNTLSNAICSIGFMLFAIRNLLYLDDIKNGSEAETDFLSLAVYLMSFEFMLISPLAPYNELESGIKERKMTLAKASAGLETFIWGLFRVTVFGFAFERIREAGILADAIPWMNQVLGIIAVAIEFYIMLAGFCEMSQGLALIGGVKIINNSVSIDLRSSVSEHVSDFYESGANIIRSRLTQKGKAWQLVLVSVVIGICFGFGAGWCAFAGLLLLAMLIEAFSDTKTFADGIITFIVLALGYILLASASPQGLARMIGEFGSNAYEFDMSYSMFSELTRSWGWLILGILSVTPLYKWAYTLIREKMSADEKSYSAIRVVSAVATTLMLIISAVAMVSAI